jgi:hypothetical protein
LDRTDPTGQVCIFGIGSCDSPPKPADSPDKKKPEEEEHSFWHGVLNKLESWVEPKKDEKPEKKDATLTEKLKDEAKEGARQQQRQQQRQWHERQEYLKDRYVRRSIAPRRGRRE